MKTGSSSLLQSLQNHHFNSYWDRFRPRYLNEGKSFLNLDFYEDFWRGNATSQFGDIWIVGHGVGFEGSAVRKVLELTPLVW